MNSNAGNSISKRIHIAFKHRDEKARYEAVKELITSMRSGRENVEEGIPALLDEVKAEHSALVLSCVWYRLPEFGRMENVRAFAEMELESPTPDRRRFCLYYLANTFPNDRERLFRKMANDPDPFVLSEAGDTIAPVDPRAAVETWCAAQRFAPVELAVEVLPYTIGQYADEETIRSLRYIVSKDPSDHLSLFNLRNAEEWSSMEYLAPKLPVRIGKGYVIQCPGCSARLGVRSGHEGEPGRCRQCGKVFTIPTGVSG